MPQMKCVECGTPFVPREAKQRFCSPACRIDWFAHERREAVKRFRQSNADQDEAPQSYFAMEAARLDANSTLIGSATPPLAGPQWSRDLAALPKEPPLGDDVNSLPDCSGIGGQNLEAEDGEAA